MHAFVIRTISPFLEQALIQAATGKLNQENCFAVCVSYDLQQAHGIRDRQEKVQYLLLRQNIYLLSNQKTKTQTCFRSKTV